MKDYFLLISPHEWFMIFVETIATALLTAIIFRPLGSLLDRLIYGRWKTIVTKPDGEKVVTELTPEESKKFIKSPLELNKYLKGEASNYSIILDVKVLSEEAKDRCLFEKDKKNRIYYLDLTKCRQARNNTDLL